MLGLVVSVCRHLLTLLENSAQSYTWLFGVVWCGVVWCGVVCSQGHYRGDLPKTLSALTGSSLITMLRAPAGMVTAER